MIKMWRKLRDMLNGWKRNKTQLMHKMWIKRGIAFDNDGKHPEALAYYDAVLAANPRNSLAWSFKGKALLTLGRFQDARKAFQNFINFAPAEYEHYIVKAKTIIRDLDAIIEKKKKKRGL